LSLDSVHLCPVRLDTGVRRGANDAGHACGPFILHCRAVRVGAVRGNR
jgi:hypothetical protein